MSEVPNGLLMARPSPAQPGCIDEGDRDVLGFNPLRDPQEVVGWAYEVVGVGVVVAKRGVAMLMRCEDFNLFEFRGIGQVAPDPQRIVNRGLEIDTTRG